MHTIVFCGHQLNMVQLLFGWRLADPSTQAQSGTDFLGRHFDQKFNQHFRVLHDKAVTLFDDLCRGQPTAHRLQGILDLVLHLASLENGVHLLHDQFTQSTLSGEFYWLLYYCNTVRDIQEKDIKSRKLI